MIYKLVFSIAIARRSDERNFITYCDTNSKAVSLFLVTSLTREPLAGFSLDQESNKSATTFKGVHSSKLAPGIPARLVAVSKQIGRMAICCDCINKTVDHNIKIIYIDENYQQQLLHWGDHLHLQLN